MGTPFAALSSHPPITQCLLDPIIPPASLKHELQNPSMCARAIQPHLQEGKNKPKCRDFCAAAAVPSCPTQHISQTHRERLSTNIL